MSMWTELNALSVHPSCIHFAKAGAVVLLHPEVCRDDSCLAFQLSGFYRWLLQISEGLMLQWGHCTLHWERRQEPHCQSDLLFVRFASPARGRSSIFHTCRSIAWHLAFRAGTTIWCAASSLWRCGCITSKARQLRKDRETFIYIAHFLHRGKLNTL